MAPEHGGREGGPRVRVEGAQAPVDGGWPDLALQFGGNYAQVRQFKAQFLKDLAHVLAVYPVAKVEPPQRGSCFGAPRRRFPLARVPPRAADAEPHAACRARARR